MSQSSFLGYFLFLAKSALPDIELPSIPTSEIFSQICSWSTLGNRAIFPPRFPSGLKTNVLSQSWHPFPHNKFLTTPLGQSVFPHRLPISSRYLEEMGANLRCRQNCPLFRWRSRAKSGLGEDFAYQPTGIFWNSHSRPRREWPRMLEMTRDNATRRRGPAVGWERGLVPARALRCSYR